jgi:hypothetical protein
MRHFLVLILLFGFYSRASQGESQVITTPEASTGVSKHYLLSWWTEQGSQNTQEFFDFIINQRPTISHLALEGHLDDITVMVGVKRMLQSPLLFSKISERTKILKEEQIRNRAEDLVRVLSPEDLGEKSWTQIFVHKLATRFQHVYILHQLRSILVKSQDKIPADKLKILLDGLDLVIDEKTQWILSKVKNERTLFRVKGLLTGMESLEEFRFKKLSAQSQICRFKVNSN